MHAQLAAARQAQKDARNSGARHGTAVTPSAGKRNAPLGDKYEGWSRKARVIQRRFKALAESGFEWHIPLTLDPAVVSANPHLPYLFKPFGVSLSELTIILSEQPGKLWVHTKGQKWSTVFSNWKDGAEIEISTTFHNNFSSSG